MSTAPIAERVLAIASDDPILHHLAPLGLAASVGRCLVVDLDPSAPQLARHTLAQMVEDGLTAGDLRSGPGVAVVGNGGISYADAAPIVDELVRRWPRVVLRPGREPVPGPSVLVSPMLPAPFGPTHGTRSVVQLTSRGQRPPEGAIALPPLRRSQVHTMLGGAIEPGWRWVRAFRPVWELAWE